jgi:hypothetical protein
MRICWKPSCHPPVSSRFLSLPTRTDPPSSIRPVTDRKRRGSLVTRLWGMGIRAGAIAPAMDIPDGKKGIDWLDVFVLLGKAGFPALGSVEQALHQAA